MLRVESNPRAMTVIELLPGDMALEIARIAESRRGGIFGIREICLRRSGLSELNISGEKICLRTQIDGNGMEILMQKLVGGGLYAHRDSISLGYISLPNGIRVGVCGSAGYDGGKMVGVSKISSLNFRIPTDNCQFADELFEIFQQGIGSGMLIYSSPGVGKTTALRSLAKSAGGGKNPMRVVIVDERFEFFEDAYTSCRVDILRGYKRRQGIEIATRTMSAELIIIDEIGAEDATSIIDVVRCGVPIIASVHASSFEEIMKKTSLSGLVKCKAFETFIGINLDNGNYRLKVDKL